MIPILFPANSTEFTTNGLGRLTECISCSVTEERNGVYELEFEYPVSGRFFSQMLVAGGVVCVIHDDRHDIQPFDINGSSAPIDGVVTFYASHISYRLNKISVVPYEASSCAQALSLMKTKSMTECLFNFWTDKEVSSSYSVKVPSTIRSLLAGQRNSILDVYGKGEYQFDVFDVKLYLNRGEDSNVTIRYGKNLIEIEDDRDKSRVYNAVAPYWQGEDGTVVTLPEGFVKSDDVSDNEEPTVVPLDLSERYDSEPTIEQIRQAGKSYLSNNKPYSEKRNVRMNFAQLWQTPEYASVAALQRLSLCDTASIYYPELDVVDEK